MAGPQSHDTACPAGASTDRPAVLIVVAPFYRDIADGLLAGARAAQIEASGADHETVEVPGALEIADRDPAGGPARATSTASSPSAA